MRWPNKTFMGACVLVLMLLTGGAWRPCLAGSASQPEVLARLGSAETITVQDVDDYVARRVDARALLGTAQGLRHLLKEMAVVRVLVLEGEKRSIPRRVGDGSRFDDAYALAVRSRLMPSCEPPKDEREAKAFYDSHPEAFRVPGRARVSRLVVRRSDRLEGKSAGDWLTEQARLIASGKRKFDDLLAVVMPLNPGERMGDLGYIDLGEDSPVVKAIASAPVGGVVGPVRDGDSLFLFLVTDKKEAVLPSWDVVRLQAAARAVEFCRETAIRHLTDDLLKKYDVRYDEEVINRVAESLGSKNRPQGPDITR